MKSTKLVNFIRTDNTSTKMVRTSFNEIISKDHPVYKPAKNRYWVYGALGCPFSHRVMIARSIKGLNSVIGLTIAHWLMGPNGWQFVQSDNPLKDQPFRYDGGVTSTENDNSTTFVGVDENLERLFVDGTNDPHYNTRSIKELYKKSDPEYAGVFSVPILWDLETQTIVNNDSGQIVRLLNSGVFDEFAESLDSTDPENKKIDLAPVDLIPQLDEYNKWLQVNINSGVYKVNNAVTQEEYEMQSKNLYNSLDDIETTLSKVYFDLESRFGKDNKTQILANFYLFNNQITDSDIRLFTTIIRFDPAYYSHFNCNFRNIRNDYPFIHLWLRNLYWNHAAFKLTTNFDHIKLFYAKSFKKSKPTGLVTLGPEFDILPLGIN